MLHCIFFLVLLLHIREDGGATAATAEDNGSMQSGSQYPAVPSGFLFDRYPFTGEVTLDTLIDGRRATVGAPGWRCYDGDLAHVYGYVDYRSLMRSMNDSDWVPYKSVLEDGSEKGLLFITYSKYYATSTGMYDEVTLATPVTEVDRRSGPTVLHSQRQSKRSASVIEGCRTNDMTCVALEKLLLDDKMQVFILKMWLDDALSVATGIELLGINKYLADDLDVEVLAADIPGRQNIVDKIDSSIDVDSISPRSTFWTWTLKDSTTKIMSVGILRESPIVSVPSFLDMLVQPIQIITLFWRSLSSIDDFISGVGAMVRSGLVPFRRNIFVQPKGVYPKNNGASKNPILFNAIWSRGGESLRLIPASECVVKMKIVGEFDDFIPVACYYQKNTQIVLVKHSGDAPLQQPLGMD